MVLDAVLTVEVHVVSVLVCAQATMGRRRIWLLRGPGPCGSG